MSESGDSAPGNHFGKYFAVFLVLASLIFAGALYYTQVYAYYEDASAATEPAMVSLASGAREPIPAENLRAIDGTSSPIRFRACFTTSYSLATLTESYQGYARATPLVAPGWFDCFDAVAIGEAIERGEALAFLDTKNIHDGVDRVIAVFPDGRAYAWQQLNEKYAE